MTSTPGDIMNFAPTVCIVILTVLSPSISQAQKALNEFELVKDIFGKEKRSLIAENIDLTEEQMEVFWTIYDDYDSDHGKILKVRFDLLSNYTSKYSSMSHEVAEDMIDDLVKSRKKEVRLEKKYARLIRRKINAKAAARFIFMEDYIQLKIREHILSDLPFIQP